MTREEALSILNHKIDQMSCSEGPDYSVIIALGMAIKALENGTPIPDNATNGDAVKTLFSNTLDNFCERTTWEWNRWWNAPYQKGGLQEVLKIIDKYMKVRCKHEPI